MKRLIEYDPLTKTKTFFEGDGGKFKIAQEQDVESILNTTKRMANDSEYKRQGIKNDMYHFARVPNTILHEILIKYGIDWTNDDHMPQLEKILQTEYKALLTVDKI